VAISFPILTERLSLSPFTAADLDAVHVVFGDAEVMRFVPGGPRTRAGSHERLAGLIEHQRRHGFSKWAVRERAGGALIGDCGLQLLDDGPDVELGFHLARSSWGHGYATEAARACLAAAFAGIGLRRVVAVAAAGNAASVRVLLRIGMHRCGRRELLGWTFDEYEATHPRGADSIRFRAR
jgi:RimJ/RimL family protein N-acetyltransferase